jgi:hypothetical protein
VDRFENKKNTENNFQFSFENVLKELTRSNNETPPRTEMTDNR